MKNRKHSLSSIMSNWAFMEQITMWEEENKECLIKSMTKCKEACTPEYPFDRCKAIFRYIDLCVTTQTIDILRQMGNSVFIDKIEMWLDKENIK